MTIENKLINSLIRVLCGYMTAVYLVTIRVSPRWLNPIELFIISLLGFIAFGQGKELVRRLLPFVVLTMCYEAFRGIADNLNERVTYQWLIDVDRFLLGEIPTITLQNWLWTGSATWYDSLLYLNYMLHFVVPWVLALFIWKHREKLYWKYITSIVILSYMAFFTFLAIPAAPPWWVSDRGLLVNSGGQTQEVANVVGSVWERLDLTSTPETIQIDIAPNPVAAVPSLHAGYAFVVLAYATTIFKTRWKYLSFGYFFAIMFGAMYLSQHYLIDLIIGVAYAAVAMTISHKTDWRRFRNFLRRKLPSKFANLVPA